MKRWTSIKERTNEKRRPALYQFVLDYAKVVVCLFGLVFGLSQNTKPQSPPKTSPRRTRKTNSTTARAYAIANAHVKVNPLTTKENDTDNIVHWIRQTKTVEHKHAGNLILTYADICTHRRQFEISCCYHRMAQAQTNKPENLRTGGYISNYLKLTRRNHEERHATKIKSSKAKVQKRKGTNHDKRTNRNKAQTATKHKFWPTSNQSLKLPKSDPLTFLNLLHFFFVKLLRRKNGKQTMLLIPMINTLTGTAVDHIQGLLNNSRRQLKY